MLTTPDDPSRAIEAGLAATLAAPALMAALGQIIHGTTLVTNAVIERKGARTGLLTTEGFRDVLEIGREPRYDLYDLEMRMPEPLVPRRLRLGVAGADRPRRTRARAARRSGRAPSVAPSGGGRRSDRGRASCTLTNPRHERARAQPSRAARPA